MIIVFGLDGSKMEVEPEQFGRLLSENLPEIGRLIAGHRRANCNGALHLSFWSGTLYCDGCDFEQPLKYYPLDYGNFLELLDAHAEESSAGR